MRKLAFSILFTSFFFSVEVWASETAEIEQAKRQLESAKQALLRAEKSARNMAKPRVYFDYRKAQQDITLIQQGLDRYLNSNRAQPRDPSRLRTLSGDYDKVKN